MLSGTLDVHAKQRVESLLPDPQSVDRVILDCSDVTVIDSSILTVLMRYHRRFREAGNDSTEIVIVANPSIRRIFDITGLNRVLTILSSTERREV